MSGVVSYIKKTLDILLFTNIFLSVCVTSMVYETSLVLTNSIPDYRYPLFMFSSTLFLYCFHRIYKLNINTSLELDSERHKWIIKNKIVFLFVLVSSFLLVVFSVIYYVPFKVLIYLLPVGFISFGYTVPCIPYKKKFIRLRDIPGMKIFLITLVLGLTTVLLPVLAYSDITAITRTDIAIVFLRRMLFIFAITIPFDIRDITYDKMNGTQTIPVSFGIRKSKIFALTALLLFCAIAFLQPSFFSHKSIWYSGALVVSAIPAAIGIIKTQSGKSDYFYSGYMEGTMLLQSLLIIAAHKFV